MIVGITLLVIARIGVIENCKILSKLFIAVL